MATLLLGQWDKFLNEVREKGMWNITVWAGDYKVVTRQ